MSAFYFSKTFSVMYNIVYIFSKCKCFRGHSYATLKERHLPAHAFVYAPASCEFHYLQGMRKRARRNDSGLQTAAGRCYLLGWHIKAASPYLSNIESTKIKDNNLWQKKEFTPKFHDGDKVKMHNCLEADLHKDKVWTCRGDSFQACSGDEVVFLQGYRGYFDAECLKKV